MIAAHELRGSVRVSGGGFTSGGSFFVDLGLGLVKVGFAYENEEI